MTGKPKCGAKTRSGGKCGRPAGWGTEHVGRGRCKLHAGSTETHKRQAELEQAKEDCVRLGVSIDTDPRDALARELCCTYGNVVFYQRLVNELPIHPEHNEWVPGEGETPGYWKYGKPGLYGELRHESGVPSGRALPHVFVELLDRERKHLVLVAAAAARAGVEERRVKLEEERGRMIADLIRAIFDDKRLGLSDAKRKKGLQVAAEHLRLVAVNGEAA